MPPNAESGSFATRDAVTLLHDLVRERFSGSLRAERGVVKVLYLVDGQLACASSRDPEDRLGVLLLREGRITAKQLDMAQDKALPGEALGSVLVNLGFIGPGDLMWGARRQVERVLASLLTWKEGSFSTRPGALPDRAVNLKLDLAPALIAGARSLESREEALALLASMDQVYRVRAGSPPADLDPETTAVLALVDGRRDLRGVCSESSLEEFEAAKIVLGLCAAGFLERAGEAAPETRPHPTPPADEEEPGEATPPDPGTLQAQAPPHEPPPQAPAPSAEPSAGGPAGALAGAVEESSLPTQQEAQPAMFEDFNHDQESPRADLSVPEASRGLPPRTWLLGAGLLVVAVVAFYLLRGGGEPGAPDPAGGGLSPGTADAHTVPEEPPPAAEPPAQAGTPADDAPPDDPPGAIAKASPRTGTEPAVTAPSGPAKGPDAAVSTPTRTLEMPPDGPRLEGRPGYQAGLEAFQAGDFSRAADLWRQQWLAGRPGGYALQVLAACEPDTLRRLQERVQPSDKLFLVEARLGGRSCYRVFWGTYATRDEAAAAGTSVPPYFTGSPWPVPLSSLVP